MAYQFTFLSIAKGLYWALKEDAFYQTLESKVEGGDEDKHQAMLRYFDYALCEAKEFGRCYLPEPKAYGASLWHLPLSQATQAKMTQDKHQFIQNHMGNSCLSAYQAMCQFMDLQSKKLMSSQSWYLSIVGVDPEFQGQGLGPGLVTPILKESDKSGVATYLETFTARNKTFYFRLGYQVIGSYIEPLSNATYWLMKRPAGGADVESDTSNVVSAQSD